jgi:hypothetical protein
MADLNKYTINFNATSVVAGILTIDFPFTVANPLQAIIKLTLANTPSFIVGVTKIRDTQSTVNVGDCPDGWHKLTILYY